MTPAVSPPLIDLTWFEQARQRSTRLVSQTQQRFAVLEYQGLRWIRAADGSIQSMLLLDDPAYPVLGYVKALLCSLLFVPHPRNLLNLGLGSGAIERFMQARQPDLSICSIEPEADMISLSKEYFYIDEDYPVREQTAENFLAENQQQFDIILCDIHPKPGDINPILNDLFFQDMTRALSTRGIAAINFLPIVEQDIVAMLLRLRRSFTHVALFDVPSQQNIVLYCSNSQFPERSGLFSRTALPQLHNLEAETVCEQLIFIPEK
jgi:spermidine synthase